MELAARLRNLAGKWMAEGHTVEDVLEKLVVEQLANTMPAELRIWVAERKPKTGLEAGQLAEDYLQARPNANGLSRLTADDDRVTGEGGRSVVDQDPVNH